MTTDESSTSCAEDSSDGQVFDVIREESVRRRPSRPRTADDDAEAATPTVAATETTSPVDSSGVDVVVDSNQLQSTDAVVSPSFAGSAVHGLTRRVELTVSCLVVVVAGQRFHARTHFTQSTSKWTPKSR